MILSLISMATLFSCEKKERCWICEQELLDGGGWYHSIEYCGDFAGMKEIEHRDGGLYTKYRCSPK